MLCYIPREDMYLDMCMYFTRIPNESKAFTYASGPRSRSQIRRSIKARAQGKFIDETKSWGDEFHVRRLRVAFRIFAHLRVVSASRARGLARPAAVSSELGGAAWVEAQALHRGACEAMKAVRATQARRRSAARHSAQRRSTPRSRGSPRLLDLHPGRRGE